MAKRKARSDETQKLSYEQAIERLEALIERIESGEVGLEEALEQYETGVALIKRCRTILSAAEGKIAELAVAENGDLIIEGQPEEGEAEGGQTPNEKEEQAPAS